MDKHNEPTEEQKMEAYLDFMGSNLISEIAIPQSVRMQLAETKEHLIVFMWEHFIKGLIYQLELDGTPGEDLMDFYSPQELLEHFAHYQMGYWEGVNESMDEEDNEDF